LRTCSITRAIADNVSSWEHKRAMGVFHTRSIDTEHYLMAVYWPESWTLLKIPVSTAVAWS
jgi:hypothetical protein